jgi:hypothetical protein
MWLDLNRIVNNDTGQGGSRQDFSERRVGPTSLSNQPRMNIHCRLGMMAYVGATSGGVTNFANHVASDGTNVVFRCSTAGGLPIGGLTINKSDCGAAANTGLRVK